MTGCRKAMDISKTKYQFGNISFIFDALDFKLVRSRFNTCYCIGFFKK